jgi:NADH-quinone oxidoreductase subunit N
MPEVILSVVAMVLLLVNVFVPSQQKGYLAYLTLIGIVVTMVVTAGGWGEPVHAFNDSVVLDKFAVFFKMVCLLAAGLAVLISDQYFSKEEWNHGELYPLVLFATVGMMIMAAATDLMTVFLGIELLSISLYILAGYMRDNIRSNEAGLKYFLLGAFSTGFLLYGMALVYGATGTTNLAAISSYAAQNNLAVTSPMFLVGMVLMATGFSFKIAAAPFHMWTPDVYEGAPTPMTAFMSAGPKAAGFAVFMRVMILGFPMLQGDWTALLWILAVLTMTVGNITALKQDNIKRVLAYSSIAHAGYALVGFTAANEIGYAGILFYLLSYAFMNIGAFAIIVLVGKKGEPNNNVSDYTGFGFKHPLLAMCLSIFLFSLAGIPPFAGFIGKFYLFSGAVKAGYIWLAVIGVLNSAASVYYYLRIMVYMYMKKPEEEFNWFRVSPLVGFAILLCIVGVLVPGVVPSVLLNLVQQAVMF